jgi:hypothetical protein
MLNPELPAWTLADQARADAFEQQIVNVAAQLHGAHPDTIVVAFVQTVGALMVQRLQADPSRAPMYAKMLAMLATYVAGAVPPAAGDDRRH